MALIDYRIFATVSRGRLHGDAWAKGLKQAVKRILQKRNVKFTTHQSVHNKGVVCKKEHSYRPLYQSFSRVKVF